MTNIFKYLFQTQKADAKFQFLLKFLVFYLMPMFVANYFFNYAPFSILLFFFIVSIFFIPIGLKFLSVINKENDLFSNSTFWLLSFIALVPYTMGIFALILLLSPKNKFFKTFIGFNISFVALMFFYLFINSCVFPIQLFIPGNRSWKIDKDSYRTIMIDKTGDIKDSIIISKLKLRIVTTDGYESKNRSNESIKNYFASNAILTDASCDGTKCDEPIFPGKKFKIINKYSEKTVGFLNRIGSNDHTFYVAIDEDGRKFEIIDFMMDSFENPIIDDGKIFKIKSSKRN